jgi:hypothetical protein
VNQEYWLADSEARVLGPVGLDVLRDLALNGKLGEVRAVSRDGRSFSPVSNFPEVLDAIGPRGGEQQRIAVQRLKAWLAEAYPKPTHEVFRVPAEANLSTYRGAFFALARRYSPDRLPLDATPELRAACEDAFLHLAARMVDLERRVAAAVAVAAVAQAAPPPARPDRPVEVSWRGSTLEVRMKVQARDVTLFTKHPEANFRLGEVFVPTEEAVQPTTLVDFKLRFEGHPATLALRGRVSRPWSAPAHALPAGIAVRFEGLSEADRAFIRAYIARAGNR